MDKETFFESIRIFNRRVYNIHFHNLRYWRTMHEEYGITSRRNLRSLICTDGLQNGLYKCRITYNKEILKIDYDPYTPRTIKTLKVVHTRQGDYSKKRSDRRWLTDLYQQKGDCDDVLIVKNGLITDTYYTNVAFLKNGVWYTPYRPLLQGTMREKLLQKGFLVQVDIAYTQIEEYEKVSLFNALNSFGSCILNTDKII